MAIIDTTYFVKDISLPTDSPSHVNKLQGFIDSAQKKYLLKIFGYELYKLFIADLANPSESRFSDILTGVEYVGADGHLTKWEGLQNPDKESFLAYFAAYEYSFSSQNYESGNGVKANLNENADRFSPAEFQVNAYNKGVDNYYQLVSFLSSNIETYPEFYYKSIGKINTFGL